MGVLLLQAKTSQTCNSAPAKAQLPSGQIVPLPGLLRSLNKYFLFIVDREKCQFGTAVREES
jgi:hypothetical protein